MTILYSTIAVETEMQNASHYIKCSALQTNPFLPTRYIVE